MKLPKCIWLLILSMVYVEIIADVEGADSGDDFLANFVGARSGGNTGNIPPFPVPVPVPVGISGNTGGLVPIPIIVGVGNSGNTGDSGDSGNNGDVGDSGDSGDKVCTWEECKIGGECVAKDAVYDNDTCQICDPWRDANAYSFKLADADCAEEISVTCNEATLDVEWTPSKIGTDITSIEVKIDESNCTLTGSWTTGEEDKVDVVIDYSTNTDCFRATDTGADHITDETTAKINIIKLENSTVERNRYYEYEIVCRYKKEAQITGSQLTIGSGVESGNADIATEITFAPSLTVYSDDAFATVYNEETQPFVPLYVKIENDKLTDKFKIVVRNCFATPSDSFADSTKYNFFDKCGDSDASFEMKPESPDDLNIYQYKINAFRFPDQTTLYLHCVVGICRKDDDTAACSQTCPSDELKRRKRSLDASSEVAEVVTVSKKITFSKLNTPLCKNINCPKNAQCFGLSPALCRCNGNYVMDYESKTCRNENIVKITNFHVDKYFWKSYDNESSLDFVRLAHEVEHDLMSQLNKGKDDTIALKVIDAKPGSIIFDLLLMYPPSTTFEHATKKFLTTFTGKETETNVPSIVAKIKRDEIPIISKLILERNENMGKQSNMILYAAVIVVSVGALLLIIAISVIFRMKRKRNETKNIGFDNNAMEAY